MSDINFEPPQAIDAEQAVLGAIMKDGSILPSAIAILPQPDLFYRPEHKLVYASMIELHRDGSPVDITSVTSSLGVMLEKVGGRTYLVDLCESVATTALVETHAKIVADKHLAREGIILCNETIASLYDTRAANKVVGGMIQRAYEINRGKSPNKWTTIQELIPGVFEDVQAWRDGTMQKRIVTTGFEQLDYFLTMRKGEVIVIAGRTSMGKTQLALQIVQHNARDRGKPCGIASLEMSESSLASRIMFQEAGVDNMAIKRGQAGDDTFDKLTAASHKIGESPIHILDTPGFGISNVEDIFLQKKEEFGIELFVIDYLQLMEVDASFGNQNNRIAALTRMVKLVARKLDVPILLLSQVSRGERGSNRAPVLSDLRDSGAIEQDADSVLFVHDGDVIIRKQRDGLRDVTLSSGIGFHEGRWVNMSNRQEF